MSHNISLFEKGGPSGEKDADKSTEHETPMHFDEALIDNYIDEDVKNIGGEEVEKQKGGDHSNVPDDESSHDSDTETENEEDYPNESESSEKSVSEEFED